VVYGAKLVDEMSDHFSDPDVMRAFTASTQVREKGALAAVFRLFASEHQLSLIASPPSASAIKDAPKDKRVIAERIEQVFYLKRFAELVGWSAIAGNASTFFSLLEQKAGHKREGESSDLHALSQLTWSAHSGKPLSFSDARRSVEIVANVIGIGTLRETNEAASGQYDHGKRGPWQGYYWFNKDGHPVNDGQGGVKYISFDIEGTGKDWGGTLNRWSDYLARHSAGNRPGWVTYSGKKPARPDFWATEKPRYEKIDDRVQNLDLSHLPGAASCFLTSEAMLAEKGVETSDDGTAALKNMIRSKAPGNDGKLVYDLDDKKYQLAMNYLEFEFGPGGPGGPVKVGVAYKNKSGNADGVTNHWVVIVQRNSYRDYSYFDPAGADQKDAGNTAAHVFKWNGTYLWDSGSKYVVSLVTPETKAGTPSRRSYEHYGELDRADVVIPDRVCQGRRLPPPPALGFALPSAAPSAWKALDRNAGSFIDPILFLTRELVGLRLEERDQLLALHAPDHVGQLAHVVDEQQARREPHGMCAHIELGSCEIEQLVEATFGTFLQEKVQIDEVARLLPRQDRLYLVYGHVDQRLDGEPAPRCATADRIEGVVREVDATERPRGTAQHEACPRTDDLEIDARGLRRDRAT